MGYKINKVHPDVNRDNTKPKRNFPYAIYVLTDQLELNSSPLENTICVKMIPASLQNLPSSSLMTNYTNIQNL